MSPSNTKFEIFFFQPSKEFSIKVTKFRYFLKICDHTISLKTFSYIIPYVLTVRQKIRSMSPLNTKFEIFFFQPSKEFSIKVTKFRYFLKICDHTISLKTFSYIIPYVLTVRQKIRVNVPIKYQI